MISNDDLERRWGAGLRAKALADGPIDVTFFREPDPDGNAARTKVREAAARELEAAILGMMEAQGTNAISLTADVLGALRGSVEPVVAEPSRVADAQVEALERFEAATEAIREVIARHFAEPRERDPGFGVQHLYVFRPADGVVRIGLTGGCDWDPEHGFGLILEGERGHRSEIDPFGVQSEPGRAPIQPAGRAGRG